MIGLAAAPDFATALGEGVFSERTLTVTAAHGFSAHRVARTAVQPISGTLHKARLVWCLITKINFVLSVVDPMEGGTAADSRNPPT